MGGPGSGRRPTGTARATVDEAYTLDIALLVKPGFVDAHARASSVIRWPRENGTEAAVRIDTECTDAGGSVAFRYTLAGRAVEYRVSLSTTSPRFGGLRWYFACPKCGRRASKLYMHASDLFLCRVCQGLTYASTRELRKRARRRSRSR